MPSIGELLSELSGVRGRVERSVRVSITHAGSDIQSRLRTNTPVKTGSLRYSWRLGRASSSTGILASVRITNDAPHATAIEFGVDPASPSHPWALSFRKESKNKSKAGITLKAGRIWSSKAVGGVAGSVISASMVNSMARDVADSVIAALPKGSK